MGAEWSRETPGELEGPRADGGRGGTGGAPVTAASASEDERTRVGRNGTQCHRKPALGLPAPASRSPGRQDVRPRPRPAPSLSAAALSDMTSDYRHRSRARWLPLPNWAIILTNVSLWVSRWQKNRSPLCPPRTALRPPPSLAPPWRSAFSSHAAGSLTCWPRGPCRAAGQRGRRQVSPHGLSAAGNARVQTALV